MKSDLIEIEVTLHHETSHAVLVSLYGDRRDAVWVPKSACEIEDSGKASKITLRETLAADKGLV